MVRSTMSTLTRLISSLMAAFSCWMVDGLVSWTLDFRCPLSMKSGGDRSGEWGAHGTSVFRLSSLPGKRVCSHISVALALCGVAPSCWSHCSSNCIPVRCLIAYQKGVRARLMYRFAVMVTASSFSSSKKRDRLEADPVAWRPTP